MRRLDGRSGRRPTVVPFLSRIERDRVKNFQALISRAKQLLPQIPGAVWQQDAWTISSGRLLRSGSKNILSASLAYRLAPKLSNAPLNGDFADLAKALVTLRFCKANQSIENQRSFIAAVGYLAHHAKHGSVAKICRGDLDAACESISRDYSDGAAYNMHKTINEIAAHCDANGLCLARLDYKYSRMRRPDSVGGLKHRRLDDPAALETESDKMVMPAVYELIGLLHRSVPFEHPCRIHILVLTLLACLGRRFSEIALLVTECLSDKSGKTALSYFQRKLSHGDTFTPSRKAWLPSDVVDIVSEAVTEAIALCAPARAVAATMRTANGPDLTFLNNEPEGKRYYKKDLADLKLPPVQLDAINGWIRENGLAHFDPEGAINGGGSWYTTRAGIEAYCRRNYSDQLVQEIHLDQFGRSYFLDDMLFCVPMFISGGYRAFWLSTKYSHSSLDQFLVGQLPKLAEQFAPDVAATLDFTSHNFRHTINTLLDEGGLPDLLQTKWFGRSTPRDTKAYQHTSRERRVLEIRAALQNGTAEGRIAQALKRIPALLHEAYLAAQIDAVHDVGTGFCVHKFVQTPCPRHLQCSADCNDYVWISNDEDRKIELMRQWAITSVAQETASKRALSARPQMSSDWMEHNRKKLATLEEQLRRNNIAPFDPHAFLKLLVDNEG